MKMRSISSFNVTVAKHLFCFVTLMGIVIVGYYNYSLFNQTKRMEDILSYLEDQKKNLREIQSKMEGRNASFIAHHRLSSLQRAYYAQNESRQWFDVIRSVHKEQCKVNTSSVDWINIPYIPKPEDFRNESILSRVRYGGLYKPEDCKAKEKIAIIVSYRDREEHLKIFLYYMHAFLQTQKVQYGIYVVEMALPTQFNRGLLNNVGYETARSIADYDCYIFHDVDLLPKYIHNYYSCPDGPMHFAARNMKYSFLLPYKGYIGGVFGIPGEAFEKVNGFSNLYFGWGREDDDFRERVYDAGYEIQRPEGRTGTYIALHHEQDTSNPDNPDRFTLYKEALWRYKSDGLNSMMYNRLALEFRELYTWIYVQANEADIMKDYQKWKDTHPKKKSNDT